MRWPPPSWDMTHVHPRARRHLPRATIRCYLPSRRVSGRRIWRVSRCAAHRFGRRGLILRLTGRSDAMLRTLAPLALAAALHAAVPPAEWVPVRWAGGPLEMERRARDKTGTTDHQVRRAIEN